MRRAFASGFLSILLLTTFLWGGCISCDQYFMWPGSKDCCAGGHCKKKAPAQKNSGRECKQIAFDHQKSFHLHVDLAAVAVAPADFALRAPEPVADWRGATPVDSSPPDLHVVNSIFRI